MQSVDELTDSHRWLVDNHYPMQTFSAKTDADRSRAPSRRSPLRWIGWRDRVLLSLVAVFTLLIQLNAPY